MVGNNFLIASARMSRFFKRWNDKQNDRSSHRKFLQIVYNDVLFKTRLFVSLINNPMKIKNLLHIILYIMRKITHHTAQNRCNFVTGFNIFSKFFLQ